MLIYIINSFLVWLFQMCHIQFWQLQQGKNNAAPDRALTVQFVDSANQ